MAFRKTPPRAPVRKAKPSEDWIACYDARGNLVGICDPKDITPVSGPATGGTAKALPKPKTAASTEAAAGEEPQMGIAKRQKEIAELRKGLTGPGLAPDQDRLALEMGQAAQRVLRQIHRGRPTAG